MKSRILIALLPLAALFLTGCLPEERIWWSPKGDRALVLVQERLHFVGEDGAMGESFTGEGLGRVWSVDWLPDGSGFVCHRVRMVAGWDEAKALIPADEVEAIERMSVVVLPLLELEAKLAARHKDAKESRPSFSQENERILAIAFRRVYQRDTATIENLLQSLPDGADLLSSLKDEDMGFEVSELCFCKLEPNGGQKTHSLVRSMLHPPLAPKVSPSKNAVAFLRADEEQDDAALDVISLEGTDRLTVARHVSAAFDWSSDGRALVFMAPIGGEGEKLQSIHRLTIVQENGKLMKPRHQKKADGSIEEVEGPDRLAEPVTLATAVTLNRPALQVLPDDRVLFASSPMTLPAAGTGPELEGRLYVISPDGKSVQPVPTAPGDLPTNLGYFVASPDGRRVAVVEAETDAVAVVEVDSGRTQIISPPHPRWQCRTVPSWKSATELTFAALHGSGNKPSWVLWSEGAGLRSLSEKWPADLTSDWLEHKTDESSEPSVPAKSPKQ